MMTEHGVSPLCESDCNEGPEAVNFKSPTPPLFDGGGKSRQVSSLKSPMPACWPFLVGWRRLIVLEMV